MRSGCLSYLHRRYLCAWAREIKRIIHTRFDCKEVLITWISASLINLTLKDMSNVTKKSWFKLFNFKDSCTQEVSKSQSFKYLNGKNRSETSLKKCTTNITSTDHIRVLSLHFSLAFTHMCIHVYALHCLYAHAYREAKVKVKMIEHILTGTWNQT